MTLHVCLHLRPLEDHLTALGHKITSSGQVWTMNCRFWVYFDVVLDCEALKARFQLPASVSVHRNDDPHSGRELGLVCDLDHDAVMGRHPEDGKGFPTIA